MQEQVERMMASAAWDEEEQARSSFGVKGPGQAREAPGEEKRNGLDAIIAPCGGGGLLSGTAISCEGTGISVFAAEPSFEGANDIQRGLACGRRIETVETLTLADGLRTPVGRWPWTVIHDRKLVKAAYSVGEEQIKKALRLVLERLKTVAEPSAVLGLAVALFNEDFRALVEREAGERGWDLGVVVSGGNVSVEALGKMFAVPEKREKKEEREEDVPGKDGETVVENVAGCRADV